MHVHQDDVEGPFSHRLDRFHTVIGHHHVVSFPAQQAHGDPLIDQSVFDQQDAPPHGRFGRRLGRRAREHFAHDARPDHAQDGLGEIGLHDRLGQVASDSQFAAALGVTGPGGRRNHDQRAVGQIRVQADAFRQFEAVHFGHHQIQQQQPVGLAGRDGPLHFGQSGCPAVRERRLHLPAFEDLLENAPVRRVVVDDQGPDAGQRRQFAPAGSGPRPCGRPKLAVKWKVEPRPTSLSTLISPFIRCTNCWQMASPSPVPP